MTRDLNDSDNSDCGQTPGRWCASETESLFRLISGRAGASARPGFAAATGRFPLIRPVKFSTAVRQKYAITGRGSRPSR